jgi:exonuclease SbcC
MVPRKLELKNFLSYGSEIQAIDFSRHSLICLSGKNGNGKSALLDAMTWALWGQARKVSAAVKPDEGLIRLGQTQMLVSLEFEIGPSTYRIRREFAKTYGKPYFALEFELYNSELSRFVSMTEKTTRQTQEKIEKTVGLDYDTFINSAFLRQGQSNEFSKKNPKERKQILSNILGFTKYDKLQQAALDKIRKFNDEKKLLQLGQEQITTELLKEPELKNSLTENSKNIETINKKIDELNILQQTSQEQKSKITELKNIYQATLNELEKTKAREQQKLEEFKRTAKEWKQAHYKALKLPDPKTLEQKKAAFLAKEQDGLKLKREELAIQEQILKNKNLYQKRLVFLESEFEKKTNELKLATERSQFSLTQTQQILKDKKNLCKELQAKHDNYSKELSGINKTFKGKGAFDQAFEKLKTQFEKRRAFYQTLVEKGNLAKSENSELNQKKAVVQDLKNPACPFCEQILTAKRKQFLNTKLQKSEGLLNNRLKRISSVLKRLKAVLLEQHKQIEILTKEADHYKQLEMKAEDLNKKIEEIQKDLTILTRECIELEKKELEFSNKLEKEKTALLGQETIRLTHFAKDTELEALGTSIKEAEVKIKNLLSELESYKQLQEQIKQIDAQLKDLEGIQDELKSQPQRIMFLEMTKREIREIRAQIQIVEKKIEALKPDANTEQNLDKLLSDLKKQNGELSKQKEFLIQQVGRLENELERLEKLKVESKSKESQVKKVETEIEDFQFLSNTFGKNGIQALLIEEAIPDIEAEANRILSRLTDNQAQIFIESLRDLKQGGVKETMDIQISDAAGIRPYEMYSGGESFRFDFALRIAISKLLARRAGTALQTLIIDEGFGSQDEDGLSRIMNSIHAIQDDFLKIIIVSHLPEFKDNFPIHFIIEKSATGSVVKVEERG